MDLDTPPHVAAFAQYISTPARFAPAPPAPAPLAPSPNQVAGQKRSRDDLEPQRPILRSVSPRDSPPIRRLTGFEPSDSERGAVVRYCVNVGNGALTAASWTATKLRKAGHYLWNLYARRARAQQTAISQQQIAVVQSGHKRRAVSIIPGTFPISPAKNPRPVENISQQSITAMPVSQPPTTSAAPVKQLEMPVNPLVEAPSFSQRSIIAMPVSQPTTRTAPAKQQEIPAKKPETITPPDSRPSSSSGPPAEPARAPVVEGPRVIRSYRQPFEVSSYRQFQPGPIKPILKKKTNNDRDAAINDLIRRSRNVTIESPEEKAVRHTYRARKNAEVRGWNQMMRNREAEEERVDRENEAKHQELIRTHRAAKAEEARLKKEEEDRKLREAAAEIEALQLENAERERQRKEAEEKKIAEDKARRQREREARKQKAAAEAAERRVAQEAKLATKRASEEEESPDEAEREEKRQRQIIKTLSADLDEKVYQAMAVKNPNHTIVKSVEGAELSRKDFGTLLPQQGTNDAANGWLNDEIVNGYIGSIVASKKEHTHYQKGQGTPAFESYPVAWYKTYKNSGIQGISRWSRRKGIKGEALLKAERIYFPVNDGAHWTLLIISPKAKTIEFLDSLPMSGRARMFLAIAREWLEMELGKKYIPEEWVDKASVSERQNNSNDCGVFTCFNALANAKGLPYDVVDAGRIPQARRMIAATLMAGGLNESMDLE